MREIHVSKKGNHYGTGTAEYPFATISEAARIAQSGDKVIVHEGVYREWVSPEYSGRNDKERIVYETYKDEKVVIKGSERIENWEELDENVWKVCISNEFFGGYNPYKEVLWGDWLIIPEECWLHTGEVFLNGKAMYEARTLEEVKYPVMRTEGAGPAWMEEKEKILHPEDTIYQWYTESDEKNTIIYANFQGKNPNKELAEISVRKCCFYPKKTGINYITVRGFEMTQAACPWTPPTADQPGLLGTHWSKGWIIENNHIHDAKCSGISLGKEHTTGHNLCTLTRRKSGYQYQMEAVFRAYQQGWNKENIGSHIIRNNTIHDCGQNGIVGHMGCIFSSIHNNLIYNIGVKHEFFGYEIAGIKLHAAIDVEISQNNIHNCTLGTWLDWQAQGARISSNLYYDNERDLMIEVTHGPYIIDNNIFASKYNFDNVAQGGAYLHNLCLGKMRKADEMSRSTPYHFNHSTAVAGTTFVYGGDDRIYQNIFVGTLPDSKQNEECGTQMYDGHTISLEEYAEKIRELGNGDEEQSRKIKQPVYINRNVYLNGAYPFEKEKIKYVGKMLECAEIIQEDKKTYIKIYVEKGMWSLDTKVYKTQHLGMPRVSEVPYENKKGEEIVFDRDYFGNVRKGHMMPGPFVELKEGWNKILVWEY